MAKEIIVRPCGKEWVVIATTKDPITGALVRFDLVDKFTKKENAQKRADLLTHILTRAMKTIPALIVSLFFIVSAYAQVPSPAYLTASWYSVESLKREGTYKTSKGVMANGRKFSDTNYTCASRLYPMDTYLRITNHNNRKSVIVKVTDKIGKRFATKRIDLSKGAFAKIANLKSGLVKVKVEVIERSK